MKYLAPLAVLGLVLGAVIGEFRPQLFQGGLDGIGIAFNGPFSGFRNHLALKYGLFGGFLGAAVGFIGGNFLQK